MIGDVGSAYLNAHMPMDDPAKILHMSMEEDVANEIISGKTQETNGPYMDT